MAYGVRRAGSAVQRIAFTAVLVAVLAALGMALAGCGQPNTASEPDDGMASSRADAKASASAAADAEAHAQAQAAAEQTQAVQGALEPLLAEYGECVSVTYLPVGQTAGQVSVNGGAQHSSASMIKLLVLAALLDHVAAGELDLSATVEVTWDDIVAGTGTVQESGPGAYELRDLALRMIANSDNTATNVIVDVLGGMDVVNAEAEKLGLTGTVMQRKLMDTEAAAQGLDNLMTSDDAATILNLIATGQLVNEDMSQIALGFLLQQSVNVGLLNGIPESVYVGHKTGELTCVEHDGGIVLAAEPYVLVVMTEGISNGDAMALIAQISQVVYDTTNGTSEVPDYSETVAAALAASGAAGEVQAVQGVAGASDEVDGAGETTAEADAAYVEAAADGAEYTGTSTDSASDYVYTYTDYTYADYSDDAYTGDTGGDYTDPGSYGDASEGYVDTGYVDAGATDVPASDVGAGEVVAPADEGSYETAGDGAGESGESAVAQEASL